MILKAIYDKIKLINESQGKAMKKNILLFICGYLFFIPGLVIGLIFSGYALWTNLEGMAFWGYPESISYDPNLTAEAKLSRLKCPILITEGETAKIAVTVSNPFDKGTNAFLEAHISMPGKYENMIRRTRSTYLSPGEENEIRWMIGSDNAIFDHMILARVFLKLTEGHPPSRTQHCGIMSFNLWGLSSKQILITVTASSLILMSIGAYILWHTRSNDLKKKNLAIKVTYVVGLLVALSIMSSLLRLWELILIALLLIPIILFSAVSYHFGRIEGQYN